MPTNVGSYLLRDLKDPTLPEAISWLPQTLGWKIVGVIITLYLARVIYKKCLFYWNNRYRNEAKIALRNVCTDDPVSAINHYQQITNIVINYLNDSAGYKGSKSTSLIETMLNTSTAPLNETLLNEWYNTLIQPKFANTWTREKLALLHNEIDTWLSTHTTPKVVA